MTIEHALELLLNENVDAYLDTNSRDLAVKFPRTRVTVRFPGRTLRSVSIPDTLGS